MQRTAARMFYYSLCAALEKSDLAALAGLYRPDAVKLDVAAGQVLQGRDAIVAEVEQSARFEGPLRTTAIEFFVEHGDALGVEAAVATRYETGVIYDLIVLEAGLARVQIRGMISPRQAGTTAAPYGSAHTAQRQFYDRVSAADKSRDYAQLGAMCRPDMAALFPSASAVIPGRDALLAEARRAARGAGRTRRESVVSYLDAPGVIVAEEMTAQETGMPGVQDHLLGYVALVVRGGLVQYVFQGLINPRLAEIRQEHRKRADAVHRAHERSLDRMGWAFGRRW